MCTLMGKSLDSGVRLPVPWLCLGFLVFEMEVILATSLKELEERKPSTEQMFLKYLSLLLLRTNLINPRILVLMKKLFSYYL